jgi:hypothetical protein
LNATNPDVGAQRQDINAAATALGQELRFFYASNESDLDMAFGALVQQRADALLVGNDVFLTNRREQIVRWRRATQFPRSMRFANSRKVAV